MTSPVTFATVHLHYTVKQHHQMLIVSITWGESTLAEQGLTPETVEELEIPFKVYDDNNFMADPVLEETYTVKAK